MTVPQDLIERVKSGPIQFPDDWPGVFVRGDSALHFAMLLREAAKATEGNPILSMQLNGMANLMASCRAPCPNAKLAVLTALQSSEQSK